jgi:hypothetical protein
MRWQLRKEAILKIEPWTEIRGATRSSFAHILYDDKLFICGGHPGHFHEYQPKNFSDECHFFDLNHGRWEDIPPLPVPTQGFRMVGYGKFLYAFGGFTPDSRLNPRPWAATSSDAIFRFSLVHGEWEKLDVSMPRKRSSYVCSVLNEKAYFFGGWDATPSELDDKNGMFVKAIDVFHLPSGTFLPTCLEFNQLALRRAFSATVLDGRAVFAGGLGKGGFMMSDVMADVITYTPPPAETDLIALSKECELCPTSPRRFVQGAVGLLPYLPEPRFSPGIGVWDGNLLVAGGTLPIPSPYNGESVKTLHLLRPSASAWETLPVQMTEGKSFVEVQPLPDGSVLLIGGHCGEESGGQPSKLIEILTA